MVGPAIFIAGFISGPSVSSSFIHVHEFVWSIYVILYFEAICLLGINFCVGTDAILYFTKNL